MSGVTYGLIADIDATIGDQMYEIRNERRRGFASDYEMWSEMKFCIEKVEAQLTAAKELHKEMWEAIKSEEPDVYTVLTQELQRGLRLLSAETVYTAALSNVPVDEMEKFIAEATEAMEEMEKFIAEATEAMEEDDAEN